MTSTSNTAPIRGILLDIEGTTTPISFVHEVLFSYARVNLTNYLSAHFDSAETQTDLASLREEHTVDVEAKLNPPPLAAETRDAEVESVVAYVNWLIDRDRKSTALKALQGKIWKRGYLTGTLRAELFEDVAPALERWKRADLSINIFSSGSVLAQRLLFAHTDAGDLSSLIDNYFDTTTGPKTEVESYRRIARSLSLPAEQVIFISDVVGELNGANEAGMQTLLCLRPGNATQSGADKYKRVHTFEDLFM